MNILIINKRAPFDGYGAENVIWTIGCRFAEEGHNVTFFCPTPTDREVPTVPNVDFEFVDLPDDVTAAQIRFFIKGPVRYRGVYDRVDPDLVYDNPSPFLFHLAHFYGDTPIVNKVHTIYRRKALISKDHPLVKLGTIVGDETYRFLRNELFTPVSQSTADRLRSVVDTRTNRIETNHNGVDTSDYEFGFNPESKQVLYISELNRKKGVLDLLQAWQGIERDHPDASLIVAGTGALEGRAKELVSELGLDRVDFLGYVSESKKKKLFYDSKIYALPTYIEGLPLTPLEAMASGCVIVSTDTYGVRDIVVDGENGCLVEPGDVAALEQSLSNLLSNPDYARNLAEKGRDRAAEFTVAGMLNKEVEIVKNWLTDQKGKRNWST